jgi:hypothetical protein
MFIENFPFFSPQLGHFTATLDPSLEILIDPNDLFKNSIFSVLDLNVTFSGK